MDPWAYAAFAFVLAMTAFFVWTFRHSGKRYFIRPHEETEWGTLFAIVSPDNEVVGIDRYVVARQRCAELNRPS